MNVYDGIETFQPPENGTVVSIGNFDGVHLGHRRLIESARERGRALQAPVVAVTFQPHPAAIIAPQRAPTPLTTLSEKLALLESLGVDACVVLRTSRELLAKRPEQFLEEFAAQCRPRSIVEGPTFSFGRGRSGSIQTLRDHSERLGFAVTVVEELHSDGLAGGSAINSSAIRRALIEGRLSEANAMLGRPYRIAGVVGSGEHRGRTLGFPTANLVEIPHLLPHPAVYVAAAQLADDSLHLAAVNIGPQPTFAQTEARVEAHVLDYAGELRGQRLGLHLFAKTRDQVRFPGPDALIAQLHRDVEQARRYGRQLERLRSGPRVPV